MKTFARLQNGMVAEFFSTTADISTLFNPTLTWVEVTGNTGVQIGWVVQSAGGFAPPPPPAVPPGAAVNLLSLAQLQAQIAMLQSQQAAASPPAAASAAAMPPHAAST